MGFSRDYTTNMTQDKTEYHRNKALGNTWHIPSAVWLLLLIIMDTIPTPGAGLTASPIQRATQLCMARQTAFGLPPKTNHYQYMPEFSWQDHLQWTMSLDTSYTSKPLDPTLEWTVQHAHLCHPVAEFREQVGEESTTWSSTCRMRRPPGWAHYQPTFNTHTKQPNRSLRCQYSRTCYNR